MGIPKFFRWMSERYPGLLVMARENQLPEIDNFYLDMNGIIHNCTHPNDGDVHFRITEGEMFQDIFNYIDTLFKIIKPREYFFLAVDGVAPRAKMNQQRGRRFRSAKEAFDREETAVRKGDILPTEQRFDSNCITPGTKFMVKLDNALKEFITWKLSSDPDWRKVKVILSGHKTPGEGEHKVMDFIRYQRSQPGYNPETRHCLYGLDTDLIMLGLSSHEPNFMLLREEIKFNNKKSDATKGKSQRVDPTKINFNVLYLTLLRGYIEKDFLPLKPKMSFRFDLESIIDDWILICFLVGNDFIPHIPHFHIHKNALPRIFEVYQSFLLKTDGYMNERGVLNLKRFKIFARILAKADFENYRILLRENGGQCTKNDFSKLNTFVRQKMRTPKNRRVGVHNFTEEQINNSIKVCADGDIIDLSDEEKDRRELIKARSGKFEDFIAYKKNYYREKFKIDADRDSVLEVVHQYVRALQWNLHYYYHGCISWGWFYPYHYAPFISDIANFKDVDTNFEMGEPFKPYDQLLSVLPAASSMLLPKVYRSLVSSHTSPLAQYFPTEVEYDLNGKQNDWEAVVLAPFIDEDALLKATVVCNLFLSGEERNNNAHGPHLMFYYSDKVRCVKIPEKGFYLPRNKIKYGLLKKNRNGPFKRNEHKNKHIQG